MLPWPSRPFDVTLPHTSPYYEVQLSALSSSTSTTSPIEKTSNRKFRSQGKHGNHLPSRGLTTLPQTGHYQRCPLPPSPLPNQVKLTDVFTACYGRVPIVIVRFKSVGSAPIMKQNYYKITGSHPFSAVHTFLRKELGWGKTGVTGTGGELVSWTRRSFRRQRDEG